MPPCSLHHAAKAVVVSTISLFRPERPGKPLSVTVAMWMSVAVTPLSVAVLAAPPESPGLHTFVKFPKPPLAIAVSPPPAAADAAGEFDAAVSAAGLPLRLHEAATSTRTTAKATPRNRFIGCPPGF